MRGQPRNGVLRADVPTESSAKESRLGSASGRIGDRDSVVVTDKLHSVCFARMILVARISAVCVRNDLAKKRENNHELKSKICSWRAHRFGYVGTYVSCPTRRVTA